jgi:hypothetical protein
MIYQIPPRSCQDPDPPPWSKPGPTEIQQGLLLDEGESEENHMGLGLGFRVRV